MTHESPDDTDDNLPTLSAELEDLQTGPADLDYAYDADDDKEIDRARAARALELEERSLRRRDPLRALIGSLTARQILIAGQYSAKLEAAIAASSGDVICLQELAKPLAVAQLIHRQIQQYAEIELRLRRPRKQANTQPGLRGFKLPDNRPFPR